MKKNFLWFVLIIFLLAGFHLFSIIFSFFTNTTFGTKFITDKIAEQRYLEEKAGGYTLGSSEGWCEIDSDCVYAGDGCGGGHGICTSNPQNYKGRSTTCDIVASHPSNQDYSCGCVQSKKLCGWKKN